MIRRATEKDRGKIDALLMVCCNQWLPKRLGGYSLVDEVDGEIVAFVWALTNDDSDLAYVDVIAVHPKRRNSLRAFKIMQKMMLDLYERGVKRVVGVLPEGAEFSETLAKIYANVGMTSYKAYVVAGKSDEIIDWMKRRAA